MPSINYEGGSGLPPLVISGDPPPSYYWRADFGGILGPVLILKDRLGGTDLSLIETFSRLKNILDKIAYDEVQTKFSAQI